MYIAIMNSENYEWIGFGKTELKAKNAIGKEWNSGTREAMTVRELDEYYGIYVVEYADGKCIVL